MPRSHEAPGLFKGSVKAKTVRTACRAGPHYLLSFLDLYGRRIALG